MKLWFNCELKFIFYYFISEIIIKSPFSAAAAVASSSSPFISIARIALTATSKRRWRKKISLEGNFISFFIFMKMALLNGDDDYHSKRHDISSWLNTLRKLWSLNISHHQQQPTFLSEINKYDCLYPFTFASLATASSHKEMNLIYIHTRTNIPFCLLWTWGLCVCDWWVHKMVIKNIKSPHNREERRVRLISSFLYLIFYFYYFFVYVSTLTLSLWLYKIIFSYLNYKHASLSLSPSFSSIIIIICVFSSSSPFQSFTLRFNFIQWVVIVERKKKNSER